MLVDQYEVGDSWWPDFVCQCSIWWGLDGLPLAARLMAAGGSGY